MYVVYYTEVQKFQKSQGKNSERKFFDSFNAKFQQQKKNVIKMFIFYLFNEFDRLGFFKVFWPTAFIDIYEIIMMIDIIL